MGKANAAKAPPPEKAAVSKVRAKAIANPIWKGNPLLRPFLVELSLLREDPENARTHPPDQIAEIADSYSHYGQQKPLVAGANLCIKDGNGQLLAARSLGWTHVAVLPSDLEGMDLEAYALKVNTTPNKGGWDYTILSKKFHLLDGANFDTANLGWDAGEIESIKSTSWQVNDDGPTIESPREPSGEPSQVVPTPREEKSYPEPPPAELDRADALLAKWRVEPGQLWLVRSRKNPLVTHRLVCGDCADQLDVDRLMEDELADTLVTSPPYASQREYDAPLAEWNTLMQGCVAQARMSDDAQLLFNLGTPYFEGDWDAFWWDWTLWMKGEGWRKYGWYVWDQGDGLPGQWHGRLAPCHEFVFHFNKNRVDPEKTQPTKTYGDSNNFKTSLKSTEAYRDADAVRAVQPYKVSDSVIRVLRQQGGVDGHPAPFSVEFARKLVEMWPGVVYEPFSGSGSTVLACEQLGVPCRAVEVSPRYCAVALERFALAGLAPIRDA